MKSVYVAAIISITILLVSFCSTLPVQAGVMCKDTAPSCMEKGWHNK